MMIGDLNSVEKKQNYHLIFALNPRFEEPKNSNDFFAQSALPASARIEVRAAMAASVQAALAFKKFFSTENLSARLVEEGVAFIVCDTEDEAEIAFKQISETKPPFIKSDNEIVVVSNNVEFAREFYLRVADDSKGPDFRK